MASTDIAPGGAARPVLHTGPIAWARTNLFSGWFSSAFTLVAIYLIVRAVIGVVNWGFLDAVWSGPNTACQALEGKGACWAVIGEKYRFILFGRYDYAEQWRPLIAMLLFVSLIAGSCIQRFWGPALGIVWAVGLFVLAWLMWGGFLGLSYVSHENWGGLPLTLILSGIGMVAAFPLGILLALGRRSNLPAIKAISVGYIELVRGVPLITVLFMASVMFPLFLPNGVNFDKLLRAQVAIIMFAAAYLAEVIRGGLQAIPKGQAEAADALGLAYWPKTLLIILPQALRIVIPPLVNTFISTLKDTSLVVVIGLFDLLSAGKAAIADPLWRGYYIEAYVFVGLIYFCFCFFMSKYSQSLERELQKGVRR